MTVSDDVHQTFCAIPSLCNPPGRILVELRNFPHVMNKTVAAVLDGPMYAYIYLQSRYSGIDTGIQIRCPHATPHLTCYGESPRHSYQAGSQFLRGNPWLTPLRRYNISGFLCRQSPHCPQTPPLLIGSPILCAHSLAANQQKT